MDIFLLNVSLSSGSIPSATGHTARSLLFGGKSKSLGAKRFEKGRAKSGTNPEALIFKQHLYIGAKAEQCIDLAIVSLKTLSLAFDAKSRMKETMIFPGGSHESLHSL